MAPPRPREDASFPPRVLETEGRLARREESVRLRLADLENRLATLEAEGEHALAFAVAERAALARDLDGLERELACLRTARSAVATLRPAAARVHLESPKAEPSATTATRASKEASRRGIT